ncbi:hypothetical protein GQ55_5G105200 [Panicum hallii var. hallii]|jgi:hypothetical protein|uniref:Uncharacterized protein n=1 Tax=Panicum hallii var. hallii TaxID=1504633 RepID=A0A2T7DEX0_9POAL|nr:hypothetical protein GQ55_5G105200 [Panicum hallii var. hallii]
MVQVDRIRKINFLNKLAVLYEGKTWLQAIAFTCVILEQANMYLLLLIQRIPISSKQLTLVLCLLYLQYRFQSHVDNYYSTRQNISATIADFSNDDIVKFGQISTLT